MIRTDLPGGTRVRRIADGAEGFVSLGSQPTAVRIWHNDPSIHIAIVDPADYDLHPYPIDVWRDRLVTMLGGTYGTERVGSVPCDVCADVVVVHVGGDFYVTVSDVASMSADELGLPEDSTATYAVSVDRFTGRPLDPAGEFECTDRVVVYPCTPEDRQTHTSALAPVVAHAFRRAEARMATLRDEAYEAHLDTVRAPA